MTPGPVRGSIHFSVRPDATLRAGDTVTLKVIKQLDAGKWAVAVSGRVYPATSGLALEAGATLRARVGMSMGRIVLTVTDVLPDAVSTALRAQGVPPDAEAQLIAHALARSGLPILAETVQKVKSLLGRTSLDARTGARAAATLVDRRIDLSSDAARALLPVLAFGQKGGDDPRRYRGRDLPHTPEEVGRFAGELPVDPADRTSVLEAYNHVPGTSETWVVIPFLFNAGSRRIAGTVKILYDTVHARPLALTLTTETISFHLPLAGKRKKLMIYCDEAVRGSAERGLDSLRAKFHNMGLEVDDTVNGGDTFDGFSPFEEGMTLPRIDTVG